MKPTIAIIGAGQRGKDVYGSYIKKYHKDAIIVGVAEPSDDKRNAMEQEHNIPPQNVYRCWQQLLAAPKFCDAIIIATPDDMHFEPAKLAITKGYHLLLEKPISNSLAECIGLAELAKKNDLIFMIGHVLRYTPFFTTLKQLISEKTIGELVTIQHTENIGFYHFAHSFVRGIWKSEVNSSPLILAKSCHDLDILLWLVGADCSKIASYGHLSHFKSEGAPTGASQRCQQCTIEKECPYSAIKIYYPNLGQWPTTVVCNEQSEEALSQALQTSEYGRCVYYSENDVVDHQVTIFEFTNGVTATFNLSAFTNEINRTTKIMGTHGEIRANMLRNEIEVTVFGNKQSKVIVPQTIAGGHGGGDGGLIADFVALLKGEQGQALTAVDLSIQSHVMAFAAEESRRINSSVTVDDFNKKAKSKQ